MCVCVCVYLCELVRVSFCRIYSNSGFVTLNVMSHSKQVWSKYLSKQIESFYSKSIHIHPFNYFINIFVFDFMN